MYEEKKGRRLLEKYIIPSANRTEISEDDHFITGGVYFDRKPITCSVAVRAEGLVIFHDSSCSVILPWKMIRSFTLQNIKNPIVVKVVLAETQECEIIVPWCEQFEQYVPDSILVSRI